MNFTKRSKRKNQEPESTKRKKQNSGTVETEEVDSKQLPLIRESSTPIEGQLVTAEESFHRQNMDVADTNVLGAIPKRRRKSGGDEKLQELNQENSRLKRWSGDMESPYGATPLLPTAEVTGKQQRNTAEQDVGMHIQIEELISLCRNFGTNISHIAGNQENIKHWIETQPSRDEVLKTDLESKLNNVFNKKSSEWE